VAAPEPPPAPECPRCGTPYAPRQEYCLECGLRLPITGGVVGTLASAWRQRLPYYPGDWIWPVLVALVIAAIAAVVAIAATRDSGKGKTLVATTTQGTVGGTVTTVGPTGPGSTTVSTTPPTTAPTSTSPPPPANQLTTWPAGTNGYTVVLNSVPTSGGRAHAEQLAQFGIAPFDLLVANLYPFRETVAAGGDFDACVEQIDIGGPAMVRAAAKNHANVAVVTAPSGYPLIVEALRDGDWAIWGNTTIAEAEDRGHHEADDLARRHGVRQEGDT